VIIRDARPEDGKAVSHLLDELGYTHTEPFIEEHLSKLTIGKDNRILVAELGEAVLGILSIHFIPQLALAGDFARITYFCVSKKHKGRGIGRKLIEAAEALARERRCDRMEVHCHFRRTEAHQFYFHMQYEENRKYLIKML
jgi:GNAT superfamily N-acetyltransferase